MRYTLVTDGSSDRTLVPILTWAIRQAGVQSPISPEWADFRRLRQPPSGLLDRTRVALQLYPCDVLFVHRDAERVPMEERCAEIHRELSGLGDDAPPYVPVVPVRMVEAWLLHDELAIRVAAGNPNGDAPLGLPPLSRVESEPDPKSLLRQAVLDVSELNRRRRRGLRTGQILHRIAEIIDDYSPLDTLPAFAHFRSELARVVARLGLTSDSH